MAVLRRFLFLALATAGMFATSGCCCCCSPRGSCGSPCGRCGLLDACGLTCGGCGSPCGGCGLLPFGGCGLLGGRWCLPDDYHGAGSYYCNCGCGELYLGDWHSFPPKCCDPCDCHGNYTGCQAEGGPWYQLPPRVGTVGPAPRPPMDMPAPRPASSPSTIPAPAAPMSRTRSRRASPTSQVSYDEPPHHCAACGN
jgi:hypothetical protein